MSIKVNKIITDTLIKRITESGKLPWQKPWRSVSGDLDCNLTTRKPYRGINAIMTFTAPYASPYWLTYKQAAKLGGNVIKGSRGTPIIYWNWVKVKDDDNPDNSKMIPFMRYYTVFNLQQIEGIDAPVNEEYEPTEHERIEAAENICSEYENGPAVSEVEGDRAFYNPGGDSVTTPTIGQYERIDEYYSVMFHELGHSTGHKSRLDRDLSGMFGNHAYSKEELIAEFTACFLCGRAGLDNTVDNSAAYLQSWVSKLKEKPEMLIQAAQAAQKAFDHILGETVEYEKAA